MNPDRIKDLLFELTELPSGEQASRLSALDVMEPELARELRSLLGHAQATSPGLHAPERLLGQMQQAELPTQLGPWRVLGELGRGGMGVVLRAERCDGAFEKEVAIKVLPPLLAGGAASERFVQEARLLAPLDHPHIARLIDAGVAHGCAYFVMDLVEGLPITRQARSLPLKDRLKLFLQLASAVSFAHGRLLIHRDIKPANVLVDNAGLVRLLDFGIAKLVSANEATLTAQAFTPAYASPEQLLGEPATVASDVFSLGVVLYELCANAHPFLDAKGDTARQTAATMFAVLQREPDRAPMQRAGLAKDLQAVLLKALAKESAQRYGSVDALASDVEAFLTGHPVKAQPLSWHYETRKFVQRHLGAVTTTAVTGLTIVALGIWSIQSAKVAREQSRLAEKRLESVRQIANKVVFDYNRALAPINGTLELRKTLVSDAIGYLEAQLADAGNDLSLHAEIARGFEAVGEVQGSGVTSSNLGQVEAAKQSFDKAFGLRERACQDAPQLLVAAVGTALVPSCSAQANAMRLQAENLFAAGKGPDAIAKMEAARALNARQLPSSGLSDASKRAVTKLQFGLNHRVAGLTVRQSGEGYARGLALAQESLPLAQSLAADATDASAQVDLRDANDFLGNRLLAFGKPVEALAAMNAALEIGQKNYSTQPSGSNAIYVMTTLSNRADIHLHLRRLDAAEADSLAALELARKTHQADPNNAFFRARYANIGRRAGAVLNQVGTRLSHATALRLMTEVAQASGEFKPSDGVFWFQHQGVLLQWAEAAFALGDLQQAQKLMAQIPAPPANNPRAALDAADAQLLRAKLAAAAKQAGLAKEALDAAIAPMQQRAQSTPSDVMNRAALALACDWASKEAALAAEKPRLGTCAAKEAQALQASAQLTPFYADRLKTALGVK